MSIFDYKYVGNYLGEIRLSIPCPDGGGDSIVIDPPCTPQLIKNVILTKLSEVGFTSEQIERMMRDWDVPTVGAANRVVCSARKDNTSGYLGVSPRVFYSSISYVANFMENGKSKRERFSQVLYPYLDHFSISDAEIQALFIKACRASDKQRGYKVKSDAEYLSYYEPVDWVSLLSDFNRLNGKVFKGLTITHRPASNFAYQGDCHTSLASLERKYGVRFRRNEIPAEYSATVTGMNSWIGRKIGRKLGDLVPVYHHAGLEKSGHPYVLPFINKTDIGFKVPVVKWRVLTGDYVTFVSPIYPLGESLAYSRVELEQRYKEACDYSVKPLRLDSELIPPYESRDIDWPLLLSRYLNSRSRPSGKSLVETRLPVSNLMVYGVAYPSLASISRALKLPVFRLQSDWRNEDASEELATVVADLQSKSSRKGSREKRVY